MLSDYCKHPTRPNISEIYYTTASIVSPVRQTQSLDGFFSLLAQCMALLESVDHEQQKPRSDCTFVQSDLCLSCSHAISYFNQYGIQIEISIDILIREFLIHGIIIENHETFCHKSFYALSICMQI